MVAQSEQPWDQGLDPKSRAIAGTTGPGTGKTFNLMHRVARLLQEGKDVLLDGHDTALLTIRATLRSVSLA